MNTRETLPSHRPQITLDHVALDHQFWVSFGLYEDGRVAEVFVQAHRQGTMLEDSAKDAAILASLALQYGCPLDLIRDALTRDRGRRPMSVITSALDAVAAELPNVVRT